MNNKPLDECIRIKRFVEKEKISEREFEQYVVDWANMDPKYHFYEFVKFDLNRGAELITKALPKYILDRYNWKIDPKRKKQEEKFKKLTAYTSANVEAIAARGLKRNLSDAKNRSLKIIYDYRNEVRKFRQDMMDSHWRMKHVNNHLKKHFGFGEIPKWIDQSKKQIERNLFKIAHEIVLNQRTLKENENQICAYCQKPSDRRWVKGGSWGIRNEYVRLPTPLTQDDWDILAELKGFKKLRRQLKFDHGRDEREQALQDALEDGNERGDQ